MHAAGALRLWSLPAWLPPAAAALLSKPWPVTTTPSDAIHADNAPCKASAAEAGNKHAATMVQSALQGSHGQSNASDAASSSLPAGVQSTILRLPIPHSHACSSAASSASVTMARSDAKPDTARSIALAGLDRLYAVTMAGCLHRANLSPCDNSDKSASRVTGGIRCGSVAAAPQLEELSAAAARSTASTSAARVPQQQTEHGVPTAWQTLWQVQQQHAPLNCVAVVPRKQHDAVVVGGQSGWLVVLRIAHGSARTRCVACARLQPGRPILGVYGVELLQQSQLLVSSTDNVLHWVCMPGASNALSEDAAGELSSVDMARVGKVATGARGAAATRNEMATGTEMDASSEVATGAKVATSAAPSSGRLRNQHGSNHGGPAGSPDVQSGRCRSCECEAGEPQLAPECPPVITTLAQACTGRQPRIVTAALDTEARIVAVGDANGGVCIFDVPQALLAEGRADAANVGSIVKGTGSGAAKATGPANESASSCSTGEQSNVPAQGAEGQAAAQLQLIARLGSCHGNLPVTMVKCRQGRILTGGRNGALLYLDMTWLAFNNVAPICRFGVVFLQAECKSCF